MKITQRTVERIVARAQNSDFGLDDPDKPSGCYRIAHYEPQDLRALAMLIVSAHHAKYDLISIVWAALEEVAEEVRKEKV